ncbi:hypothetical protein [Streptomyces sp. NPDC058665]|uniref:hypothetical protein n=1 Tax=Streptomyces sp. NPDC058665 TaxID=3346586 RepID=UPI00365C9DDA
MSDDKSPPLSPQERQQNEDAAQIESQFGATDAMERFATVMDRIGFGSAGGIFSRTSFEERGLNDMLDLLDGAKPADLVRAGENLERAKTSLNEAAQELSDFVKATDWHGAAATEFQRYGGELARYAWDLGSFANVIGTQMTVAGGGLTSVRSARPPRDNRADPRRPKDFPVSEQRDDNPEYKRAVQVEENRQEAINQMNRLASFYAVSEQSLAGAKEPELPKMLKAEVPRPRGGEQFATREPAASDSGRLGDPGGQSALRQGSVSSPESAPRTGANDLVSEIPTPSTSMKIDSVTTLPPTPPGPGPAQPLPVNGGPPAGDGSVPPLGPNSGPKKSGGPPRQGPSTMPRGGNPGKGTNERTGTGGNRSPVGRPTGMAPGVGRTGGPGGTRSPMVGRPSSGGPMPGRSGSGTSGGPRAGRGSGIVGGTPQQRASGGGTGTSGARIPRGNVIGGQGGAPGRSSSAARLTGRGIPSSNGVVGTPRSGDTPPRPGTGGFTTGGSGLSGERHDRQPRDEERESPVQPRPENRTGD